MGSNPVVLFAAMAVACAGGATLLFLFLRQPKAATIAWVAVLFLTPVWFGVQAGIFITSLTAVTVIAIVASRGAGFRWSHVDTLVLVLLVTVLLAHLIGGAVWGHVQEVLTMWLLPYVWGRLILGAVSADWIAGAISAAAGVVAVLAVIEFLTAENPFFLFPGSGSSIWGTLQFRGGLPRAEGAFGHSIALGGALAISSPFILAARWPAWLRAVTLGVVALAVGMTFSRIGMVGLVLAVTLALVFLGRYLSAALRVGVVTLLGVAALIGFPLILQVFGEAGSEAEGSAEYRGNLLPLLDQMSPIGLSPSREVLATGEDYFGGFRSIDSALILTGLRFGWVPLLIIVVLLAIAVVPLFQRRASPASIALLAQIPAFATVALITQYAAFVWFIAGLAVASYSLDAGRGDVRSANGLDRRVQMMGAA